MSRVVELPKGSEEVRALLSTGQTTIEGESFFATPVRVSEEGGGNVVFNLVRFDQVARPSAVHAWLQAIRAISLTATLTPCIATFLYGRHLGLRPDLGLALASLLGVLLLQISVNLWNDVEDHDRLIDLPGTLGGAGVIQKGWLSAQQVRRAAHLCLALGLTLGVPALLAHPREMFGFGILAALGSLGYSGKPFGFKYRALGDLTVLLLCGPGLTAGFALATFGEIPLGMVALGMFFGMAAVGILHSNNMQDISVDRSRGASTVASVVGERVSRVYFVAVYVLALGAWGAAASLAGLGAIATLVPLGGMLLLLPLVREVFREADLSSEPLKLLRIKTAQIHLLFGVLICVSLAGSHAFR